MKTTETIDIQPGNLLALTTDKSSEIFYRASGFEGRLVCLTKVNDNEQSRVPLEILVAGIQGGSIGIYRQ